MADFTTSLSENGQVMIPPEIRGQLGLLPGDRFEVVIRGEEVVLKLLPRGPLYA